MSKTERYDPDEDIYNDIKRHDNPNHWGHYKHEVLEEMAEEEIREYVEGRVFINFDYRNGQITSAKNDR